VKSPECDQRGNVMVIRTLISVLLSSAGFVSAQAQSFDGSYQGSVTITKRVGNPGHECPAVGGHIAIVIRVSGGTASLTHAFATYPGTVNGNGKLRIQGARPTPGSGDRVSARYTGAIRGRRVSGSAVATTSAGECHGRFRARR